MLYRSTEHNCTVDAKLMRVQLLQRNLVHRQHGAIAALLLQLLSTFLIARKGAYRERIK